jgi:hypothetical protein
MTIEAAAKERCLSRNTSPRVGAAGPTPSESAAGGGCAEEARHGKAEREGLSARVLRKGMRERERECGTGAMADNFSILSSSPAPIRRKYLKTKRKKEKKRKEHCCYYWAYSNLCRSKMGNSISSFGQLGHFCFCIFTSETNTILGPFFPIYKERFTQTNYPNHATLFVNFFLIFVS